jgi:hypothetical protein
MTDATRSEPGDRGPAVLALAAAPVLIVASIAVWWISDRLLYIGPFDRAQVGWVVVVPLFLLAPAAAALAARSAGRRTAAAVAAVVATVIGGLVVASLSATVTQIGCTPVSQGEAARHAIPTGLAAGLGFLAAVAAGMKMLQRGAMATVAAAVGVSILGQAVTLLVFGLSYPGVSCAAPFPV